MVLLNYWGCMVIVSILTDGCLGFVVDPSAPSSYLCQYIIKFNCTELITGTMCGTNGVTYGNHCLFSKAMCHEPTLNIKHNGPCKTEKEEQELVLSLACHDLLNMDCTSFLGTTNYCATDGRTYKNVCHFEKARCTTSHLYLYHVGPC